METLRPVSAYFVEEEGQYECFFVFNLDFVKLLEPLFPGLDASFYVTPVMNADEFQALGDPRGGREPTVGNTDLVTDLSPEAKLRETVQDHWNPEWPYVTTQREREQRARKTLGEGKAPVEGAADEACSLEEPLRGSNRPNDRGWVEVKKPNSWRRDAELESMARKARAPNSRLVSAHPPPSSRSSIRR